MSITFKSFFRSKITIGVIIVIVLAIIGHAIFSHPASKYQLVPVQSGSITETVSLTGNTTPEQSVALSFGASGIISTVNSSLGQTVYAGEVLAGLDMSNLNAALNEAKASVDEEQAKLAGLQSGARPQDIALYQAQYADAASALVIAMQNAYLQSESAILRYTDTLFQNGASVNPILEVPTQSLVIQNTAQADRVVVGEKLAGWKTALAGLNASSSDQTIASARVTGRDAITTISNFLDEMGTIVGNLATKSSGLPQSDIDTDRANVNTAAQTVSAGSSAEQSAYSTWTSADQTLISEQSPAKPTDISAQNAAVESANANVQSANANIQNAEIITPLAGTVTQFDAKVGQLASPGTPLVSVMSDTGYEVDAGVSETDVGKVLVNDPVSMTLDAFPNETFTGTVFYIAPAETNTNGVISYLVKISFDKADPRLKSGLTANIDIQTQQKDNVLILPEYAILQNDSGTFVETLQNGKVVDVPVTLGIEDQKGNVEVTSGVIEGEQVLNIGLKTQ